MIVVQNDCGAFPHLYRPRVTFPDIIHHGAMREIENVRQGMQSPKTPDAAGIHSLAVRMNGSCSKTTQHSSEHQFVNRPEQIPVQKAGKTARFELCGLPENG